MEKNHYQTQFSALRRLRRLIDRWQHRAHRRDRLVRLRRRAARLADQLLALPAVRKAPAALAMIAALGFGNAQAQISFAAGVTDPFGLDTVDRVILPQLVDLDGDGDLDILANSYDEDSELLEFRYYENTGTPEVATFGTPQINPFELGNAGSSDELTVFTLADLDGDGDLDLLAAGYQSFTYLSNDGTATAPSFSEPATNPFGLDAAAGMEDYLLPSFADLDGDGDVDLLLGGYYGTFFVENTGSATAPAFGAPVAAPFNIDPTPEDGYFFPALADFDQDGDTDVLLTSYYSVAELFENTGDAQNPAFAAPQTDLFSPFNGEEGGILIPAAGDLDNDGDVDLLIVEYDYGTTWHYFENTSEPVSSTMDLPADFAFEYGPVPATDQLTLRTNYDLEEIRVENALGQTLQTHAGNIRQLSLDGLANGLYYLRAVLPDGRFGTYRMVVSR